jgi:hypothetical protein
LGGDA